MTKVVKISIFADVGGITLNVEGAVITLGVNAIPRIELQCAPSEVPYTPLRPTVKRPKISDFSDLYNRLSKMTHGLSKTGNVTILVTDNKGGNDQITLKEWVISGVGMSSVSSTAAPYLSVILEHPICRLTKSGSIYQTFRSEIDIQLNKATKDSEGFLDVVKNAYRCIREADFIETSNGLPEKFTKQLGVAPSDPDDYLVFKGDNGIFLSKLGDGVNVKPLLAMAIGRLVNPEHGGASTWDMIVNMSGLLLLSVTQDNDNNFTNEKLVIEPTQPWKTCTLKIDESDCSSVDLPGMNPFMISGVMATKPDPSLLGGINQAFCPNGNPNGSKPAEEILYVPVKEIETADGRIMKVNPPRVLVSAMGRDAAKGASISGGLSDMNKNGVDAVGKALEKYCKAVYEITACSMVQARAQLVLCFRDSDGNLILPGNTCKFVSGGESGGENVIFYGYVRQVVHSLSTSHGCSTVVGMSYVRPEADFKIDGQTAIAAGAGNAAYE